MLYFSRNGINCSYEIVQPFSQSQYKLLLPPGYRRVLTSKSFRAFEKSGLLHLGVLDMSEL